MGTSISDHIYSRIGVTPVINGIGNKTWLGGSTPTPRAREAMADADEYYVEMPELIEKTGEYVADLLDVEAAFITSGCASAILHSAAGCIAGKEKEVIGRLPDTNGLKDEFVIQKKHRYFYDRCYVVPGGQLVVVGDEDGCTVEEMDSAIGPSTAGIGYVDKTRDEPDRSVVSIDEAVELGRAHDVPLIVDAAYQAYPVQKMRWIAGSADLVCFGGKYFGAPSATGFVCGRKDLVSAAARQGFVASQSGDRPRSFGRSMKVDRQAVVGMTVALEDWLTMDHEDRVLSYLAKASIIDTAMDQVPTAFTNVNRLESHAGASLAVQFEPDVVGKTGFQVAAELGAGVPRIIVGKSDNEISITLHTLLDGHAEVIADRLVTILKS